MNLTEIQKSISTLKHSKPFFNHVRYLLPDDSEYKWFLQWMAYSIQYPDLRCQVTPLHISREHGTGRGSLTNMIMLLVGHWNCAEAGILDLSKSNEFTGQFLDKKIMVFIHEVQSTKGKYEIDSDIRSILSDKFLDVNLKHGKRGSQRVFINFLMFSNHADALVLTEQDRRMYVLTGPTYLMPNDYYTELTDWIEDAEEERHSGMPEAYWWLNKMDLSDFEKVRAPKNAARQHMINAGKSDDEIMVDDFLITNEWSHMTLKDIRMEVIVHGGMSEFSDDFEMSMAQLGHILIDAGCVKNRQTSVDGRSVRLWSMAGPEVNKEGDMRDGYRAYREHALKSNN